MARVWEDFLTEQDEDHLGIREHSAKKIWGMKPAVLNIDNYRSVAGDERMDILDVIKIWPGAMGDAAWDALDNIADLLASAREAGMPIAHVRGLPEEESGVASWGAGGKKPAAMARSTRPRTSAPRPRASPVSGTLRSENPPARVQ